MNIRNTTAKERMLKKIRQALLENRDNPFPEFEDSSLYVDERESLDLVFAKELTAAGGSFVYCEGEIAVIENLIGLVEELEVKKIYAWEKEVQTLLGHYGFPILTNDSDWADMEVGITTCEALIARNGSVLISSNTVARRTLSIYPSFYIVLAKASQLVMDIKHGLALVKKKYGNDLPSVLEFVTGLSQSFEFDDTQRIEALGPKQLYVFLIEDRF